MSASTRPCSQTSDVRGSLAPRQCPAWTPGRPNPAHGSPAPHPPAHAAPAVAAAHRIPASR
eukprot:2694770-Prymnesium_polylepis.1